MAKSKPAKNQGVDKDRGQRSNEPAATDTTGGKEQEVADPENDAPLQAGVISSRTTLVNPTSMGSIRPGPSPSLAEGKASTKSIAAHPSAPTLNRGRPMKDLWKVCCNEVAAEREECNKILCSLGLPSLSFSKDKRYPLIDYEDAPELGTSKAGDFLDFYIFPILIPGIQALIQFAKENRVFQSKFTSFNGIDFIVQYLYNNNPRYPERLEKPNQLEEIPFVQTWLEQYPRPRQPKWLVMPKEEAVRIIQRNVRGFFVRVRPEVQEMRQFWKTSKEEKYQERVRSVMSSMSAAAERFRRKGEKMTMVKATLIIQSVLRGFLVRRKGSVQVMRLKWKEEQDAAHRVKDEPDPKFHIDPDRIDDNEPHENTLEGQKAYSTHSEDCIMCSKFKDIILEQERLAAAAAESAELSIKKSVSNKRNQSIHGSGDRKSRSGHRRSRTKSKHKHEHEGLAAESHVHSTHLENGKISISSSRADSPEQTGGDDVTKKSKSKTIHSANKAKHSK